jgi:predicted ester cyclase
VNVFEAGIAALAVCFATGLAGAIGPGAGTLAQWRLMQVVTAAGVVGAIAIDATAGWLHGFWPVAVIVIAIVLGEVLADQRATREHVRRRGVRQKNLQYAADWLADDFVELQVFPGTPPDKKVAIDSYRIFFAASPDMTAEIHDMVAAGDRVAIGATYRGIDQGGFIPGIPATGMAFDMEAMYIVRVNDQGQIAERWGVVDTIATMAQLGLLPSPGNVGPA